MNALFALILWAVSLAIFYLIIKTAVKRGVMEANQELLDSVLSIERKLEQKLNR